MSIVIVLERGYFALANSRAISGDFVSPPMVMTEAALRAPLSRTACFRALQPAHNSACACSSTRRLWSSSCALCFHPERPPWAHPRSHRVCRSSASRNCVNRKACKVESSLSRRPNGQSSCGGHRYACQQCLAQTLLLPCPCLL